jgi:hypothetical protein
VKNDFIRIENIINSILTPQCQRDLFSELQSKPVCSCQFKTATAEKKYAKNELMAMIKADIEEYLTAIRSQDNYNKIVEYKVTVNMVKDVDAPAMCSSIFSTWTRRHFRPLLSWKRTSIPIPWLA